MSEVFALLTRWPTTMSVAERARSGGMPVGPATELASSIPTPATIARVGEEGELCLRGPVVLRRYLGDPEATAGALAADGWFRTGDLCRLTGDGGFEFLARLGDSLRLRGFLVAPAEIEARLELHPAVELAQVVGAEVAGRGQVAVAFVRLVGRPPRTSCATTAPPASPTSRSRPASWSSTSSRPSTGPNGVKILKRDLRDDGRRPRRLTGGSSSPLVHTMFTTGTRRWPYRCRMVGEIARTA